jgi:acyl-CoA reductase-like NAD-dependent aldehyde dehydrogenase
MAEIQPAGPLGDTCQLYIDGKWVEPEDGRYDDVSPVTEQTIATAPNASVAQVGDAIGAARRAFDGGPWGQMSNEDRAGCLNQLGDALMKHSDEFFALAQAEWGCIANVRMMQIDGAGFMSMHAASLAAQLGDQSVTGIGAGTTLLRHEPVGVVSILTPWNFPHTLNVMKLNNALAAGNTVVLKPSPLTPLTGLALARVIDEHTDIPPGVVNVVTPSGIEAAKLLTTDPRIDMISFTGSTAIGREVMSAASDTLKRILLELGGKSASVILDDTVVTDEMLQQMLFESCSLHSGQACILHSRLLLPDSLHDDVVDRLVALARDVKVGTPADPDVQMGPLISAAQRDRVQAHVDGAINDGRPVWRLATTSSRPFSPRWSRIRPSRKKRSSVRCSPCCAIATTTMRWPSRTTPSTGFRVPSGALTWTARSALPAASGLARSRSTASVPATRRSVASS